jgi:ribose transport system permease protein
VTSAAETKGGSGPVGAADDSDDPRAVSNRSAMSRWLRTNGAWVLFVDIALIVLFGLLSQDHVFWSVLNFQAIALASTEFLLLTLGLAMLLGAAIFDLSLGANLVLSSVVGGWVVNHVAGPVAADGSRPDVAVAILLGVLAALTTGVLFGLVNGLIVAYLDVNSLIATLGTLGAGTGIALIITSGGDVNGLPPQLQTGFGLRTVGIVPLPAVVAGLIAVVLWAVLRYTRYGLRTLAIGSSRVAAERSGLRVRPHLISLTMLAGLLAGIAGVVDFSRYDSTTVSGHAQDGLAAFTAAVIGGTVLEGGRVNILGAVWGTVLAVVLGTGLIVIGVAPYYQLIVIGVVLIAAVAIDRFRSRARERV